MDGSHCKFEEAEARNADTLIALALEEDLAKIGDITGTATIPCHAHGAARFVARRRECWPG